MNALPADIPYRRLLPPCRAAVRGRCVARIVANAPIADALARLDMQAAAGGAILDIRQDGGAAFDTLLARLDALGDFGAAVSVVIVPPDLIDIVTARVTGARTRVLVAASPPRGWKKAARRASGGLPNSARRSAASRGPWRRCLPTRPSAIRRSCVRRRRWMKARWSAPSSACVGCAASISCPSCSPIPPGISCSISAPRESMGGWSRCPACASRPRFLPLTLRWITQMTEQALLVRRPDPSDGRRVFIGLSDQAAAGMDGYLAAARAVVAPVG